MDDERTALLLGPFSVEMPLSFLGAKADDGRCLVERVRSGLLCTRSHPLCTACPERLSPCTRRTRPARPTTGRVLDRMEVRSMMDVRSTMPGPAIPGWRLILSDKGRLWAVRREAFPRGALRAGAEITVDVDTFDALKAEVARQVTS
ncbi:hypothetical protein AB0D67_15690 [Streptosporangium sp. NPDC048047]|uniref:hypothetical protein n=1 Tax=Streptosporangium sp. NPDC048047 TaxID=3155748 RepID=UPI00342AF604